MKNVYKGVFRKTVVINNTGSKFFDKAFFILKDTLKDGNYSEDDMISEAERIINEKTEGFQNKRKIKEKMMPYIFFLCGFFSSFLLLILIYLLI